VLDKSRRECYNKGTKKEKEIKKMMTVHDVMEFLAQQAPDSVVIPCNWGDEMAIRVFTGHHFQELRWADEEEEED
jgi:hypothetical protein